MYQSVDFVFSVKGLCSCPSDYQVDPLEIQSSWGSQKAAEEIVFCSREVVIVVVPQRRECELASHEEWLRRALDERVATAVKPKVCLERFLTLQRLTCCGYNAAKTLAQSACDRADEAIDSHWQITKPFSNFASASVRTTRCWV